MKMGMNLLSVVCRPQVHKNKHSIPVMYSVCMDLQVGNIQADKMD